MSRYKRIVLDTNILIDCLCQREPFYEDARLLLALGRVKEFELWIGTSQISDLIYVITDGGLKSKTQYAQEAMVSLSSMLHIHASDEEDYMRVAQSAFDDLEDASVLQTALRVKADAIITRDKAGFAKSPIKTMECSQFFDELLQLENTEYSELIGDFIHPKA